MKAQQKAAGRVVCKGGGGEVVAQWWWQNKAVKRWQAGKCHARQHKHAACMHAVKAWWHGSTRKYGGAGMVKGRQAGRGGGACSGRSAWQ